LTAVGSVPGFRVRHSEEIVRVDAAVCTSIAGNGWAEVLASRGLVEAEELVHRFIVGLGAGSAHWLAAGSEEFLGVAFEGFGIDDAIAVVVVGAPELTAHFSWDRL
jgi:hypothetical protein